ncbi:MAG: hypothetical protein JHC95_04040 [Solirubrobacteraceae bacterium]|nr:hypothetical protein [Solirubrobacteraceae bacterium]
MTRQDRTMIMVAICVAIAAASWFLVVNPKRGAVNEAKAKVTTAQQAADEATAKATAALGARAGYEKDYAAVTRLGKAIPVNDDVASLVYQLESTAKQTDIDFRAVNVTEGAAATGAAATGTAATGSAATATGSADAATLAGQVTPVPLTLTFDGGYFAMTRFLRKIERYTVIRNEDAIDVRGRLVSVESVKLTPGLGGFPNVSAEVSATAYTAPIESAEAQAAADAAAAPAAASATGASATASAPAAATAAANTAGGAAK